MARYAKSIVRADGKELTQITAPNDKVLWQKPTLLTESGNGLVEMDDAVGNYDGAVQSAKFFGKTLKMCQIFPELLNTVRTVHGVTFTWANGVVTMTGTSDSSDWYNGILSRAQNDMIHFVVGHKYLLAGFGENTDDHFYQIGLGNGDIFGEGDVFTYLSESAGYLLRCTIKNGVTYNTQNRLMFYDLTQMEQELISDYASFHALYNKDYYPHGEYLVSNDSKWECNDGDGGTVDLSSIKLNGIGDVKDEFDAVSGDGVRKLKKFKMKDLDWSYNTSYQYFVAPILETEIGSYSVKAVMLCNIYDTYSHSAWDSLSKGICVIDSTKDVGVKDGNYSDVASFVNHLTDNDYIVIKLENPTTEHLTPQPITLQKGYNALRQVDGSLANTEAKTKYYRVGGGN